jgi:hypothetical protein
MFSLNPFYFLEAKEALIQRAPWSDVEKKEIQELVNKYPQKASIIDWNKIKDLSAPEVKKILTKESKKDIKKQVRKGIPGLKEGEDYITFVSKPEIQIYGLLTHKGAMTIGRKSNWCISMENDNTHWVKYTTQGIRFLIIVSPPEFNEFVTLNAYKPQELVAAAVDIPQNGITLFNKNDERIIFDYLAMDLRKRVNFDMILGFAKQLKPEIDKSFQFKKVCDDLDYNAIKIFLKDSDFTFSYEDSESLRRVIPKISNNDTAYDIIELALKRGRVNNANLHDDYNKVLYSQVRKRNFRAVKLLVENGFDMLGYTYILGEGGGAKVIDLIDTWRAPEEIEFIQDLFKNKKIFISAELMKNTLLSFNHVLFNILIQHPSFVVKIPLLNVLRKIHVPPHEEKAFESIKKMIKSHPTFKKAIAEQKRTDPEEGFKPI